MRHYLLGELSESERAALEEKYFTDPRVFERVLQTESELVDGYVRGQLPSEVRERFERSYLGHPARRARVEFARALATRVSEGQPVAGAGQLTPPVSWWRRLHAALRGRRPTLRLSIALATLALMLLGGWVLVESGRRQRQREAARVQAERESRQRRDREQGAASRPPAEAPPPQAGEPPAEAERATRNQQPAPQPSPVPAINSAPPVVSLALHVGGGVRGGDEGRTQTLVIPPGTAQARLLLTLRGDHYPSYRASLQMIGGAEIFNQTDLKPRHTRSGASFVFNVPARRLASGEYALTLSGVSPEGEVDGLSKSLFRVDKR